MVLISRDIDFFVYQRNSLVWRAYQTTPNKIWRASFATTLYKKHRLQRIQKEREDKRTFFLDEKNESEKVRTCVWFE